MNRMKEWWNWRVYKLSIPLSLGVSKLSRGFQQLSEKIHNWGTSRKMNCPKCGQLCHASNLYGTTTCLKCWGEPE